MSISTRLANKIFHAWDRLVEPMEIGYSYAKKFYVRGGGYFRLQDAKCSDRLHLGRIYWSQDFHVLLFTCIEIWFLSVQEFINFNHQVARRTEGFRKLYCGAISASTTEKMLQVNIFRSARTSYRASVRPSTRPRQFFLSS